MCQFWRNNVSILTQKMCQFFSSLNLTQTCVNISDFEILTKLCVKNSIWNFKCNKKKSNFRKRNWYPKLYLILLKFHSDKRLIAVIWLLKKHFFISNKKGLLLVVVLIFYSWVKSSRATLFVLSASICHQQVLSHKFFILATFSLF